MLKHQLVALVLAPRSKQFTLKFHHLLGRLLSSLIVVLHHLLLYELFLSQPLLFGLLLLTTLELSLRCVLGFLTLAGFLLTRCE